MHWIAESANLAICISDRSGSILWKSKDFIKFIKADTAESSHSSGFKIITSENTYTLKGIFDIFQTWETKELTGHFAFQDWQSHSALFKFYKIKTDWTSSIKMLTLVGAPNPAISEIIDVILDHTNDAIIASDEHFEIKIWNKGAERMYGYTAALAQGKIGKELMETQFVGMSRDEAIKKLIETGNLRVETIQKTSNGEKINVEVNTLAIYDENKKIRGFVSVNRDITERKKAEQRLAESERRFRHLAENAADLIYRFDLLPFPHFSYVSPSAEKIIGYTPQEHYNDPSLGFKIVHPEDRHLLSQIMNLKTKEISQPLVLRWRHKDGRIIYTEQHNTPIIDEEGQLIAIEGIARDVTRQKRLEQELLISKRLLEDAALIGNFGGWNYDIESHSFTWSPQLFLIYEIPPIREEKGIEVMRKIYPEGALEELLKLFEKAIKEGQRFSIETEINTWRGNRKWVRIIGEPITDEGKITRIAGTVQDITQHKQSEEKLKESRRKLRQLYQKTQTMLEDERKKISHELHDELGQLLTIISLDLSTVSKKTRSTEIRSLTGQMKSAIELAVDIVRRVSSELHPPLLDQLGLVPALQWLLSQISKRTKIKIKAILPELFEIPFEYPHSIHIFRIVQESFTNILRHSGATEASLIMKKVNNQLYLTIEDNGKGFNLDEVEESIHAGITGMYDRADIMGGILQIDSSPGKGTIVHLEIPI